MVELVESVESWRVLGDFGDSFCSVFACFFASNNLKLVSSSSCGAMYDALPVLKSNDGLTVSDNRFRRVRDVDMKHDFAFVEFSDPRDADDARYSLNGREFDGNRLVVEFAKGVPRGPGGSREYLGRGPLPGSGRCFNCGLDGHWARDCKAGDWKNKCYRCGERGHIEKNCHNSPKKLSRRGRSYSRSPIRSRSPRRGRSRSFSRSRSYSLSRSPPPKRERVIEREKSRSPGYSGSPEPRISPPSSKSRKRSPTPEDGSGSPVKANRANGPNNSESPRARSRSPERDSPFPSEANGRSPSPRDDRSPINDEDDNNNNNLSPRDSQSP